MSISSVVTYLHAVCIFYYWMIFFSICCLFIAGTIIQARRPPVHSGPVRGGNAAIDAELAVEEEEEAEE